MEPPQLNLPALPPPFDSALRLAMDFIFANLDPFGVVVSGSIVRGNPDASSDFDILVLHDKPWRRRIQKWFDGVSSEIFINSPQWIERYLVEEEVAGRPIMAHMLATGVVVFSSSGKTAELLEMANASLRRGASFSVAALEQRRYGAACLYEDVFDVSERDEATAALILARAVDATVQYWFASRQRFTVRSKEQLAAIAFEDGETAILIGSALLADSIAMRIEAGRKLAERVIGQTGFFEWDSGMSE